MWKKIVKCSASTGLNLTISNELGMWNKVGPRYKSNESIQI